jgi:glycosyltransferase involved in cell wall biosynthesis
VLLWSGEPGGAERFTLELCRSMRLAGADARILFVTSAGALERELVDAGIPHASLGFRRGRVVARHPRKLARLASELGPDGAILVSPGYLAAALRIGGYRGRVAAVLHDLIQPAVTSRRRRLVKQIDFRSGVRASDVEVAVSDFVAEQRRRFGRSRKPLVRIYNGVDLGLYRPGEESDAPADVVGWAGRIVAGKGLETLLDALARVRGRIPARLAIAGDGPERPALEERVRRLGLDGAVSFAGWAADVPAFWRSCTLAAIPPDRLVESFGMVAVEAMACGRPVVVSRSGALPELVEDGVSGRVVPPGDADALAAALVDLLTDPGARSAAAAAGRARCEADFDIRKTAASYLNLFTRA